MPRPPRHQAAGAVYHVTQRGTGRTTLFHDDTDYERFTRLLDAAIGRYDLEEYASCLMPNHFHLVVRTNKPNIARAMQFVVGQYARSFNDRYLRRGHLIQGRYHTTIVESEEQLAAAVRYVILNPVTAGLCARAAWWPWTRARDVELTEAA